MDLQAVYWIVGVIIAGLTLYNFIAGTARKAGATDKQLEHSAHNESAWDIRFNAMHAEVSLLRSQTAERFEKVVERLNDALLQMAREHPTKTDLHMVKTEILDRIDSQYGEPPTKRRAPRAKN